MPLSKKKKARLHKVLAQRIANRIGKGRTIPRMLTDSPVKLKNGRGVKDTDSGNSAPSKSTRDFDEAREIADTMPPAPRSLGEQVSL